MGTCGSCNLQGDTKPGRAEVVVLCLLDRQWYPEIHSCERWMSYSYNMGTNTRMAIAKSILDREDSERRHQETLKEQGITRKHQTKLVFFGFLGGILGGLILGYLLGLWGLLSP